MGLWLSLIFTDAGIKKVPGSFYLYNMAIIVKLPQPITRQRKVLALLISLASILALVACDAGSGQTPSPTYFEVDPVFRSFYENQGGVAVLGPAISPLFSYKGVNLQYLATCLMVNHPKSADKPLFELAPLGIEMGVDGPTVSPPKAKDELYLNGHIVYREFVPTFKQLGGAKFVGQPLTELHYNARYNRYEQYFENLGFYTLESDPERTVRLLTYGAWKCGNACPQLPESFRLAGVTMHSPVEGLFAEGMKHLGAELTGFAISEPYQAQDGYLEQVFENVVLYLPPDNPGRAVPRPLTQLLAIQPETPVLPLEDPSFYFYKSRGNRGYNISKSFLDYLSLHGGIEETAGPPISEYRSWQSKLFRQCFVNLCLIENPVETGLLRIHPDALGYPYLELTGRPLFQVQPPTGPQPTVEKQNRETPVTPPTKEATPYPEPQAKVQQQQQESPTFAPAESGPAASGESNMAIKVWETYATVSPTQAQEINVYITSDGKPMARIEPRLTITLPDDSTRTFLMFPTGEDGLSRFTVEPSGVENGSLIRYQVCIDSSSGDHFCVLDEYPIWIGP